jgi:hypothetical protein
MLDTTPIWDRDNCPDRNFSDIPRLIEEGTDTDRVIKWNDRKERSQRI